MRIHSQGLFFATHRFLQAIQKAFKRGIEMISSGHRINRAADDVAGLTISERMRTRVKGLAQALKNAKDAISLVQTAHGGLEAVAQLLQRARILAIKGASFSYSDEDRLLLEFELEQIKESIDHVAERTVFNEKTLLNREDRPLLAMHVGSDAWDVVYIELSDVRVEALEIKDTSVRTVSRAESAIEELDEAIRRLIKEMIKWGGYERRLVHLMSGTAVGFEAQVAAESRIRDTDIAAQLVAVTKRRIFTDMSPSIYAHQHFMRRNLLSFIP
jgi:flagellin